MTEKQSNSIREYAEEMAVNIEKESKGNRLVIKAFNPGVCACTQVDLLDVLNHVKQIMPDLWESI